MKSQHAVVWIDQHEAKIFHTDGDNIDSSMIENPHHHVRRGTEKAMDEKHGNSEDAQHYFEEVAKSLAEVAEVLVVGPATAKLDFIKHVHKHDHALVPKIIGIETVDHPTDGEIVKYARQYFKAADRMR